MLKAIEITNRRRPYGAIESAAIGYFILGHTERPEMASPYFARAVQIAKDPAFSQGIINDLRSEGQTKLAQQLEQVLHIETADGRRPHEQ